MKSHELLRYNLKKPVETFDPHHSRQYVSARISFITFNFQDFCILNELFRSKPLLCSDFTVFKAASKRLTAIYEGHRIRSRHRYAP